MKNTRNFQYYVVTDGSLGDVLPMVRIAIELSRSGRSVAVIANERYQSLCYEASLGFIPWSRERDLGTFWDDAMNWDRFFGFGRYVKNWVSGVTPALIDILCSICTPQTTVIAQTMALGARIARERTLFHLVTVHLQPIFLRSRNSVPNFFFAKRVFYSLPFIAGVFYFFIDLLADHALKPVAAIRRQYDLPPVPRMLHRWIHSPDLSIALFPSWFGKPQPDWPANVSQTGFLSQIGFFKGDIDSSVAVFLKNNNRPVLVCLGSAQKHAERYYQKISAALRRLGLPVIVSMPAGKILTCNDPGILITRFIPFDQVLPFCRAFIHHGGIGSSAIGFYFGIPQLVLPMAHDQFDNAARIQALGCGCSVSARSCKERHIKRFIRGVETGRFKKGSTFVREKSNGEEELRKTIELCF